MASHAEAPKGPIEVPPAHTDAYMDMAARRGMADAFGHIITWGSLLILMVVGYATFTLTMHVVWIAALIGFAVFGVLAGLVMKMGGAWQATVVGLVVLALIVQGFVTLGGALLHA
jgi:hypothetical protein